MLAVDQLRKVNALLGFTRLDDMDRVNDLPPAGWLRSPATGKPTWTVATEDRGEGIFLQLDERRGRRVGGTDPRGLRLWDAHQDAHRRNFQRRFSETAERGDRPRHPPAGRPATGCCTRWPTLLIREMAMSCGYSAASLTERIYAWAATPSREPAAGLLICTTASDSEGTLGGLVQLTEPARLAQVITARPTPSRALLVRPGLRDAHPAATPRTSCTAPPATAARSRRRPRARGPTASSTGASCSTCPGAILASSNSRLERTEALRQLGGLLTATEAGDMADRLEAGESLNAALGALAAAPKQAVGTLLQKRRVRRASRPRSPGSCGRSRVRVSRPPRALNRCGPCRDTWPRAAR